MNWWMDLLPPQARADTQHASNYQSKQRVLPGSVGTLSPETSDLVMLIGPRKQSHLLWQRFFDDPIKLSGDTLIKLGLWRTFRVGCS
jgi:hypothetical protein